MYETGRDKPKKGCRLKVEEEPMAKATMESARGAHINGNSTAYSDMLGSISKLFESGDFSDLTIFCGDRKFNVHRAIICPRSKVLARMCQKGDGAFEEALTGKIHLKGDDPMIVEKMISFLYRLDYADSMPHEEWTVDPLGFIPPAVEVEPIVPSVSSPPLMSETFDDDYNEMGAFGLLFALPEPVPKEPKLESADDTDSLTPLVINARVYTIGDRYDIWALKDLAQQKFASQVKNGGWNSEGFSLAIREVYEGTTDEDMGLRQLLVSVAAEHIRELRDRGEFNDAIRDVPDFTHRLLIEVLKPTTSPFCRVCQNRGNTAIARCQHCGGDL